MNGDLWASLREDQEDEEQQQEPPRTRRGGSGWGPGMFSSEPSGGYTSVPTGDYDPEPVNEPEDAESKVELIAEKAAGILQGMYQQAVDKAREAVQPREGPGLARGFDQQGQAATVTDMDRGGVVPGASPGERPLAGLQAVQPPMTAEELRPLFTNLVRRGEELSAIVPTRAAESVPTTGAIQPPEPAPEPGEVPFDITKPVRSLWAGLREATAPRQGEFGPEDLLAAPDAVDTGAQPQPPQREPPTIGPSEIGPAEFQRLQFERDVREYVEGIQGDGPGAEALRARLGDAAPEGLNPAERFAAEFASAIAVGKAPGFTAAMMRRFVDEKDVADAMNLRDVEGGELGAFFGAITPAVLDIAATKIAAAGALVAGGQRLPASLQTALNIIARDPSKAGSKAGALATLIAEEIPFIAANLVEDGRLDPADALIGVAAGGVFEGIAPVSRSIADAGGNPVEAAKRALSKAPNPETRRVLEDLVAREGASGVPEPEARPEAEDVLEPEPQVRPEAVDEPEPGVEQGVRAESQVGQAGDEVSALRELASREGLGALERPDVKERLIRAARTSREMMDVLETLDPEAAAAVDFQGRRDIDLNTINSAFRTLDNVVIGAPTGEGESLVSHLALADRKGIDPDDLAGMEAGYVDEQDNFLTREDVADAAPGEFDVDRAEATELAAITGRPLDETTQAPTRDPTSEIPMTADGDVDLEALGRGLAGQAEEAAESAPDELPFMEGAGPDDVRPRAPESEPTAPDLEELSVDSEVPDLAPEAGVRIPDTNAPEDVAEASVQAGPDAARGGYFNAPVTRGVARKLVDRYLTAPGDLPKTVWERKVKMDNRISADMSKAKMLMRDLEAAVRDELSGVLPDEIGWGRRVVRRAKFAAKVITQQPEVVELLKQVGRAMKEGEGAIMRLPERVRGPALEMRWHVDNLSRDMIDAGMIQGDLRLKFANNLGTYLTRTYKIFDDPDWTPDEETLNRAAAYLRKEFGLSGDALRTELEWFLSVNEGDLNPFDHIRGKKVGGRITHILKKRGEIPEEIRALWGEYDDPFVQYARSISRMSSLVESHKFLLDAANNPDMPLFSTKWEAIEAFGRNMAGELGSKDTMGPLGGMWTHKEIADAFKRVHEPTEMASWMRSYMYLNGLVKAGKTILSPMTQIRNLVSNFGFAVASGHAWRSPADFGGRFFRAMGIASTGIGGKVRRGIKGSDAAIRSNIGEPASGTLGDKLLDASLEQRREYYLALQRLGIVDQDVRLNELDDTIKDVLGGESSRWDPTVADSIMERTAKGVVRRAGTASADVYRAGDDVWKIFGFEAELDRYVAAYKKAGVDLPEDIVETVASNIRNTYPTYSNVPLAIRKLRRSPLVGTFVAFPWEVLRTTYHQVDLAMRELNDPVLRSVGVERTLGIFAATTVVPAGVQVSRMVNGISMEDDRDAREFLPPWSRNASIIYLGSPSDGVVRYVDMSYTDPHAGLRDAAGTLGRGLMDALKGSTGEPPEKVAMDAALESLQTFFEPFISEEILLSTFANLRSNVTEQGVEIRNTEDSPANQLADVLGYAIQKLEPGITKQARGVWSGFAGQRDLMGNIKNPWTEIASIITGHRVQEQDIRNSFGFRARDKQDELRSAESILRRVAGDYGQDVVSEDEIRKAYRDSEVARMRVWGEMHRLSRASSSFGLEDREIEGIWRESGNFSKRDARDILSGRYEPFMPDSDWLESARDRALAQVTDPSERRRIRAEFRRRRNIVRDIAREHRGR